MNREIKFRGKALINNADLEINDTLKAGDWVYGSLVYDRRGKPFIVERLLEANSDYVILNKWMPVDPETVGQFTGETVFNGRLLYEGDVLTFSDLRVENVRVVAWDGGGFILQEVEGSKANAPLHLYKWQDGRLAELVLIGNIHDNPGLIGGSE